MLNPFYVANQLKYTITIQYSFCPAGLFLLPMATVYSVGKKYTVKLALKRLKDQLYIKTFYSSPVIYFPCSSTCI